MSNNVRLEINDSTWDAIDHELRALEQIGTARSTAVKKGGMSALGIVEGRVKESLPKPGYPGDKPDKRALLTTLKKKAIDYGNGVFLFVLGYEYPAGAHGHLAEAGHKVAPRGPSKTKLTSRRPNSNALSGNRIDAGSKNTVEGRWDLKKAAEATVDAQNRAMIEGVRWEIAEAQRG